MFGGYADPEFFVTGSDGTGNKLYGLWGHWFRFRLSSYHCAGSVSPSEAPERFSKMSVNIDRSFEKPLGFVCVDGNFFSAFV